MKKIGKGLPRGRDGVRQRLEAHRRRKCRLKEEDDSSEAVPSPVEGAGTVRLVERRMWFPGLRVATAIGLGVLTLLPLPYSFLLRFIKERSGLEIVYIKNEGSLRVYKMEQLVEGI
ncbi:hypothetical protein U1Q18_017307 [Sarracenia purpurea var. burkii]